MSLLRIEPARDDATGKFYIQLYFPQDSTEPFVTTQPRYMTAAAAEGDLVAILAVAANSIKQE
jgi:hypothetical protein